jgi:LAO/AO transport system kinase
MLVSAVEGTGLPEAWTEMQRLAAWRKEHGHWDARRAAQGRRWFEEDVRNGVLTRLLGDASLRDRMERLGAAVAAGTRTPGGAAAEVLTALEGGGDA